MPSTHSAIKSISRRERMGPIEKGYHDRGSVTRVEQARKGTASEEESDRR